MDATMRKKAAFTHTGGVGMMVLSGVLLALAPAMIKAQSSGNKDDAAAHCYDECAGQPGCFDRCYGNARTVKKPAAARASGKKAAGKKAAGKIASRASSGVTKHYTATLDSKPGDSLVTAELKFSCSIDDSVGKTAFHVKLTGPIEHPQIIMAEWQSFDDSHPQTIEPGRKLPSELDDRYGPAVEWTAELFKGTTAIGEPLFRLFLRDGHLLILEAVQDSTICLAGSCSKAYSYHFRREGKCARDPQ